MAISFARQRGITLIEILLVATIVAAGVVGIFALTKKGNIAAAVEREQAQVERVVEAVESVFALQPNFSALGTEGAAYLKDRARGADIEYTTAADGTPKLATRLGQGKATVELRTAQIDFANGVAGRPHNGFVLSYSGLSAEECVRLITATATRATRVDVGSTSGITGGVLVADRGQLISDKAVIANACKADASNPPVVHLSFAPNRAISAALPTGSPPLAQCAPTRETRVSGCPAGFSGSITQERLGNCTGPGNTMVYTAWTTIEDTCQADATTPPNEVPVVVPDNCPVVQHIRTVACPAGQVGSVVQRRDVDSCTGVGSPWIQLANSCQEPPAVATCVPSTERRPFACPDGQGGQIIRERSSTCSSPTADPTWPDWSDSHIVSSNCLSSCAAAGTCCTPQRQGPKTTTDQCPAGTYGSIISERERFRGCLNAETLGPWGPWQTLSTSGGCTACPPPAVDSQTQWVSRSLSCQPGETGEITFEAEQRRTRKVSYNCPAGTASLPAPTYENWTAWVDTGRIRNEVNNCVANPSCPDPSLTDRTFTSCNWDGSGWSCYSAGNGWVDVPCNVLPPPPPLPGCYCPGSYFDGVGFVSSFGSFPNREACEAARAGDARRQCRAEITPFPTGSSCYHMVQNNWHSEPRRMYCEYI